MHRASKNRVSIPQKGGRSRLWVAILAAVAVLAPLVALGGSESAAAQADYSTDPEPTWQTNGEVHAILPLGDIIYIGGEFTALTDDDGGSVPRNNLAAINRNTGQPTSFAPNLDRTVFALVASDDGSTLYVGGAFLKADNKNRKRVAAYDLATGAVLDWNPPSPNNVVRAIATDGSRIFIGGFFDKVGGVERKRLAAFDVVTGAMDMTWTPTATAAVRTIIVDPDKIWLVGNFSRINSIGAKGIAVVDPIDGSLLGNEHVLFSVLAAAAQGDQILAGGAGPGGTMWAVDRDSGDIQWSTKANGNIQGAAVYGDYAYFGGHHDRVEGVDVGQIHRVSIVDGTFDRDWLPTVNGVRGVNVVAADDRAVYLGGDFTFASGSPQQGFAMFSNQPIDTGGGTDDPPELVTMSMLDQDQNGFVDTVEATFNEPLGSCSAPCTAGWTLKNAPSGATLASVNVAGATATLNLNEGGGDPDTAVGSFTVALSAAGGLEDSGGNKATFLATAPEDDAAPVPVKFRKTNAGTAGLAEAGDTIESVWSEALDPASVPALTDVIITDPDEAGNDQLSAAGFIEGAMDMGSDDFLLCPAAGCGDPADPPPAGDPEPNMNVIMVAGNASPPSGDRQIRDLLVDEGFSLTIVDDDSDLSALDTSDTGLIVITSSVVPSKVGTVFNALAVPILTWENYLFADLGMATNEGVSSTQTQITIVDPSHPIAAGNSGNVTVLSAANRMSHGTPGADADVIAHAPFRPDQAVLFAYETGDTLADGTTAPAARVAVFPDYAGASKLTANGEDIIAAAAHEATAVDAPPPPPPATTPEVVFANSDVALSPNGTVIKVTLSACTGDCGDLAAGPKTTVVYNPATALTDLATNPVTTVFSKELKLF